MGKSNKRQKLGGESSEDERSDVQVQDIFLVSWEKGGWSWVQCISTDGVDCNVVELLGEDDYVETGADVDEDDLITLEADEAADWLAETEENRVAADREMAAARKEKAAADKAAEKKRQKLRDGLAASARAMQKMREAQDKEAARQAARLEADRKKRALAAEREAARSEREAARLEAERKKQAAAAEREAARLEAERKRQAAAAEKEQRKQEQAAQKAGERKVIVLLATKTNRGGRGPNNRIPENTLKSEVVDCRKLLKVFGTERGGFVDSLGDELQKYLICEGHDLLISTWASSSSHHDAIGYARRANGHRHHEFIPIKKFSDFDNSVAYAREPLVVTVTLTPVDDWHDPRDDTEDPQAEPLLDYIIIEPPPDVERGDDRGGDRGGGRARGRQSGGGDRDRDDDSTTPEFEALTQHIIDTIGSCPTALRTELSRLAVRERAIAGERIPACQLKNTRVRDSTFAYLKDCALRYAARVTWGESEARRLFPSLYSGPPSQHAEIFSWSSEPKHPLSCNIVWPDGLYPDLQSRKILYLSKEVAPMISAVPEYAPRAETPRQHDFDGRADRDAFSTGGGRFSAGGNHVPPQTNGFHRNGFHRPTTSRPHEARSQRHPPPHNEQERYQREEPAHHYGHHPAPSSYRSNPRYSEPPHRHDGGQHYHTGRSPPRHYHPNGYEPEDHNNTRQYEGFDRDGFDRDGFDSYGFDSYGFSDEGFDRDGFDRDGFDRYGFDQRGFDHRGFDHRGFDRDGIDSEGFARNGIDRDGFDREGFDDEGMDRDGFDCEGFDCEGFDREGFDGRGFGRDGFDCHGTDCCGYDRDGIHADGFRRDGFNEQGFDRDGYDRNGVDSFGFHRERDSDRQSPLAHSSHGHQMGVPLKKRPRPA